VLGQIRWYQDGAVPRELSLALWILSTANGVSQTLPAERMYVLWCSSDFILAGILLLVSQEKLGQAYLGVVQLSGPRQELFQSCSVPAGPCVLRPASHGAEPLWPHRCHERGCAGVMAPWWLSLGPGMGFPAPW